MRRDESVLERLREVNIRVLKHGVVLTLYQPCHWTIVFPPRLQRLNLEGSRQRYRVCSHLLARAVRQEALYDGVGG